MPEEPDAPDEESPSIEDAQAQLIADLRGLPGLTMIGIGERDGEPCLRVHVVAITERIRAAVPDSQGGWPVELRASGPIRARRPPSG